MSSVPYPDIAEPSPFIAAARYAGGELPVARAGGQAEFVATYGTDAGFADVFQLKPVR